MHGSRRLIGLAGAIAAIATTLSVGTAAAAGPATVGHVYVNNNSSGQNTIAAFDRHADGSLTPIAGSPFDAGGAGTGAPYGSAGGLQRSTDGRYLLATDPASNQISVLRIKPNGGLQLVDVEGSHGSSPVSIAVHGSLVYVANGGAGGSNYTGFRLNAGGHLSHIGGSTFDLPDIAMPGHVLISPDGRRLVGTRVGPNAGPSYLDGFSIGERWPAHARPGLAVRRAADRPVRQQLLADPWQPAVRVQRARRRRAPGSVSVYDVAADGSLSAISGSPFADLQTAPVLGRDEPRWARPVRGQHGGPLHLALRGRG